MPQKVTILRVFASCPNDLSAELNVLETVIQELNPRLRDAYGVEFRLMTAGNSVVPGIGTDPQAIVNAQISDQYDVYLGMLGARFGAPTPRAGSGTEEEFRLACDRWAKAPESVKILFYFKGMPNVPVQELDVQQLARVQEFKASIKKQIFYADFRTTDDFLPLVREHLWQLVASQWNGDKWKTAKMPTELTAALNAGEQGTNQAAVSISSELANIDGAIAELARDADNQDRGMELLDALVEAQDALQAGLAALDRIAAITREQNEKFVQHGRMINFVTAKGDAKPKDLKTAVDAVADDIASYAQALRREVPGFTSAFTSGLNAFDSAMNSWIRERPPAEHIVGVRQMLEQVIPDRK